MTRHLKAVFALGVCVFALSATLRAADPQDARSPGKGPTAEQWGLLEEYCRECHNTIDWAGGIAFDAMDRENVHGDAETWEKVVRKLRGRMMPPPGEKQPPGERIDAFVHALETRLDSEGGMHAGHVPLHRLNRKEYANAIEDLLGLKVNPAALLPPDDVSDGFDNVASVLQVSPSFIDQYLAAARTVAVQAIGNPSARPGSQAYFLPSDAEGKQAFHVDGLPLGTRGGMVVDHFFPADGEYVVNVMNIVTGIYMLGMEFRHTFVVTLDGVPVYETQMGGEEDLKGIDQNQSPTVDAINSRVRNIRFKATAGMHTVGVTFLARTFAESDARLFSLAPGGGQERIPRISGFEISGPFNATGLTETPSRRKIFTCRPASAAEEEPCAREILGTLARRAFRRPVDEADLQLLMQFYRAGAQEGGFESGIRTALTKILSSPYFLFRAEIAPEGTAPGTAFALNDFELASRLSFFLWSRPPDDELLDVAAAGRLKDRTVLEAQVRRMLADPRSSTLATNFAYQWLGIGKLDEIVPDPATFPYAANHRDVVGVDGDVREDMKKEINLFVESIFREDRSVLDLLSADHTYLNERLALHYGIRNVKGDRFRRVKLADPNRWGLLGKGGVLMATSYPNRTAPVLRGAWILDTLMGTPASAPPPNVEALKENAAGAKKQHTVRELMAIHRSNPSCNGCHGVMDPLGFALENFDAVGAWRDKDRFAGTPIDATGELPDGSSINGPVELRRALLRRPDQFVQNLTEKLMTYALGRTIEHEDMPTVRAIVRESAADNYRFSTLVMHIVESPAFLMNSVPAPAKQPAPLRTAQQP
ncbi:MAG: DUF1592 domain-containing protein [Steroidobacteraceae bacterium]|nr:DUF1592 domain-containing protein [Steroidobacteraceae bacterium]